MAKKIIRLNENALKQIVRETIEELDWKTYMNATKGAKEWRKENPYKYDRNRGLDFAKKAGEEFERKFNLPQGTHLNTYSEQPSLSASRDHDFGDKEGILGVNHNHYYLFPSEDGKYYRGRMWDKAYETTPEEFFGNPNDANAYLKAKKELDDYNSGKFNYSSENGWHTEDQLAESIMRKLRRL